MRDEPGEYRTKTGESDSTSDPRPRRGVLVDAILVGGIVLTLGAFVVSPPIWGYLTYLEARQRLIRTIDEQTMAYRISTGAPGGHIYWQTQIGTSLKRATIFYAPSYGSQYGLLTAESKKFKTNRKIYSIFSDSVIRDSDPLNVFIELEIQGITRPKDALRLMIDENFKDMRDVRRFEQEMLFALEGILTDFDRVGR